MTCNFGKRIHNLRLDRGMSLKELGEKVDCAESMLFHIERGTRKLTVDRAIKIADALGVKVVDLLGIRGE